MNNKIIFFLTCILLSGSFVFSEDDKLNETKKVLISRHAEYAKACIDRKCKKIKEKIKRQQERLHYFDNQSNGMDQIELSRRRIETINKIQKYEEQIDNLRLIKLSVETINFKS